MKERKSQVKKKSGSKDPDAGKYMEDLSHPLKEEINLLRSYILAADGRIRERVKWNAPSYFYNTDIVTFNPRAHDQVHLVFHHREIEELSSPLLVGNMKGRRMMYFATRKDIVASQAELKRIIRELADRDEGAAK